jgi:hypothetical protein
VSDAQQEGSDRTGKERARGAEQQLVRRRFLRERTSRRHPHRGRSDLQPGTQGEHLGAGAVG